MWGKLSVIIILFLLLSVAIGYFYLYKMARWYYIELNETKLDPLFFKISPWQIQDSGSNIVFIGDSRITSWNANFTGIKTANLGINGITSEQLMVRLETLDTIQFNKAIVVLQIGVNDLKIIPLLPDRQQEIITQTFSNITGITNFCYKKGASKVIVTTVFPLGKLGITRRFAWSEHFNEAVVSVNDSIKTLKSDNTIIFDSYALLEDKQRGVGWGKKDYFIDMLHLNEKGYSLLNKELEKLIINNVQSSSE